MNCKEKLEEAKRLYKFSNDDQRHVLEDLFPELKKKEDEDEKIRIAILNYLRKMWANCKDNVCGVHVEDAIAWLEKQGEQKLSNKIEPKFKVGDTIAEKDFYECGYGTIKDIKDGQYIFTDGSSINIDEQDGWQLSVNVEAKFKVGDWIIGGIYNKPKQILEIRNGGYVTTPPGWIGFSFAEDMHLWTLQDAKDGDVLVSKYNQPFIYNGNRNFCHVGSYCGLSTSDKFIVSTSKCFWTGNVNIRPATKEKCDLLFKRMEEAGYEWDANKKELKKIEPKFHVGEWLCENEPNNYARFIQILEIVNVQGKERYRISRDIHNDEDIVEFNFIEKYFHKFDIKDAKYGDVLVHNDCAFIFVGLEGNIVRALAKTLFDGIIPIYLGEIDENNDYHPAAKEQRDFLFKSMKDDGYEWDTEKKELKKIHVIDEGKAEMDYCFTKMMNGEKVSPAWIEEDEKRIANILSVLSVQMCWDGATGEKMNPYQKEIDWLKSLKDRVHPKQEWSEEDEENLQGIIAEIEANKHSGPVYDIPTYDRFLSWLKSIRPQNRWKPTEAQLASLTIACDRNDRVGFDLTQLLKELKKL